ncbi:MAG: hypothetical protein ACK575_06600 [Cyanobacteriota bacterium]
MGRTENYIDEIGVASKNFWKRLDAIFNSFAGREQAKSQHHWPARDTKLILIKIRVNEGLIWNAMGNHMDLFAGNWVGVVKNALTPLGHHDEGIALVLQLFHHPPLLTAGIF